MENKLEKKKNNYAWLILIACCAMQFGGLGIIFNCAGVYISYVTADLGFATGKFALYITIAMLCMVLTIPLAGKLLPKFDIRMTLSLSFGVILICFAAMSQFTALWQWYLAGAIVGVAGAFSLVITVPIIIGNWFYKRNGFAMGIAGAFAGIGGIVMNPVITLLIINFGWRTSYILTALISAILVLPFTLFIIRFKPADLGCMPYGYEESQKNTNINDSYNNEGVPSKKALKSMSFYLLLLSLGSFELLNGFSQLLPSYANSIQFAAAIGATMVSFAMIGNIVGKLVMGALSDKFGIEVVTIISISVFGLSLLLLIFGSGNVILALMGACLVGVQQAVSFVSSPILVRKAFGSKDFSSIYSIFASGKMLIGAFG
jgi:MFS family permease